MLVEDPNARACNAAAPLLVSHATFNWGGSRPAIVVNPDATAEDIAGWCAVEAAALHQAVDLIAATASGAEIDGNGMALMLHRHTQPLKEMLALLASKMLTEGRAKH